MEFEIYEYENKKYLRLLFENVFDDDVEKYFYNFINYLKNNNAKIRQAFVSNYDFIVDIEIK